MSGACPVTHCATASPIAGECLKPCPEHAETTSTASCSGWRSMMKRLPRVLVYRQETVRSGSAPSHGR